MARYELVALLDPRLPQEEVEALGKKLRWFFDDSALKDEDDIGLLPLEYAIKGVDRAYFLSLLLDVEPAMLEEIREKISLEKGVLRFFFYKMWSKDRFFKFKELNAKLEESLSKADEISWEFGEMNMS